MGLTGLGACRIIARVVDLDSQQLWHWSFVLGIRDTLRNSIESSGLLGLERKRQRSLTSWENIVT